MESSVLKYDYFNLRWTIHHIHDSLRFANRILESRLFYFRNDHDSLWKLEIYQETNESVVVKVCRIFGLGYYEFYLLIGTTFRKICFNVTDTSQKMNVHLARHQKHLNIILRRDSSISTFSVYDSDHVHLLSNRFRNLLTSGIYSNLTLICHHKAFHVHTFILAQRAPLFLQHVYNPEKKSIDIPYMSPQTLSILLEWIYTGSIDTLCGGLSKILTSQKLSAVHYLELLDLIKLYYLGPVFFHEATQELFCIDRQFYRSIKPMCTLNYHTRLISYSYRDHVQFVQIAYHHLMLMFCFSVPAMVVVTIRHLNVFEKVNIYFSLPNEKAHPLVFTKDICQIQFQFKHVNHNSRCYLSTFPKPSKGEELELDKTFMNDFKFSQLQWYQAMQTLPQDSGDVTLVFEAEQPVKTWKALLAAHSPVFMRMFVEPFFTESWTHRVEIPDFLASTGRELIEYLKSGSLPSTTCVNIIELYMFADKYLIKDLFRKCSAKLMDCLYSETNKNTQMYYDLLVIADACNDRDLKETARSCIIGTNEKKEWKTFCKLYPNLAKEVRH